MTHIEMYTTRVCPYCVAAKNLLKARGLEWQELNVDSDTEARAQMQARSGGVRSVPQIFVNDHHVGGYEELVAADRSGQLKRWLAQDAP